MIKVLLEELNCVIRKKKKKGKESKVKSLEGGGWRWK